MPNTEPREISLGYVPSLEAMPMVEACLADSGGIRMMPRGGYGNVVRSLLTGDLCGGLIPFELMANGLCLQPRQAGRWKVVMVTHACPVELVVSVSARKRLVASKPTAIRATFAIEGRRSMARLQIMSWLAQFPDVSQKPVFRMLPMEMMLQAVEASVVDGLVAPTPWGLHAEAKGIGKREESFERCAHSQRLVIVVGEAEARADVLGGLPRRSAMAREHLTADSPAFGNTARAMTLHGVPAFATPLLMESARLYPCPSGVLDFAPDRAWLAAEWQRLIDLGLIPSGGAAAESMADLLYWEHP